MTEKSELAERDGGADLEMESWGSRDNVGAMGKRLKAMLPGVKNEAESYRLAQASVLSRANPFRGELYIFGDNIVEGYKLLVRWAKRQEDYTTNYTKLAADDPQMQQVKSASIGYTCELWRDSVRSGLVEACKAGIPYDVAREMFLPERAVGIVSSQDTGREPPKGWSWDQVAKKRALKNALNLAYGMPSPDELVRESWEVDGQHTEAEDWKGAEELNPGDAGALARSYALDREHQEKLASDPEYATVFAATVVEAQAALYPDAQTVEGVIVEAEDEPAPHWIDDPETRGKFWAWSKGQGLSQGDVYTALKVDSVHDYPGSKADAKHIIEAYVKANTQPDEPTDDLWDQEVTR